jgi:hypothetical protein
VPPLKTRTLPQVSLSPFNLAVPLKSRTPKVSLSPFKFRIQVSHFPFKSRAFPSSLASPRKVSLSPFKSRTFPSSLALAPQDVLSPSDSLNKIMLPSRYRTTFLFVVLLTLTLTYLPMLVSSFPIVAFQDLSSHASKSNSSYIDDQVVFDVSPTFGTPRNCATTDKVFDLTSFQYYSSHC